MKYILTPVLITTVLSTGCASNPSQSAHYPKGYTGPESMHRTEVIQATRQCINAKLRPQVEYLPVKTEQGRVITPINVHCDGQYN